MKQTKLMTISFILLLISNVRAQKSTIDTVLWDSGNYSLVSELGVVWIMEHNGRTHKKVKIHTIDTLSGKIEYYFEGTFHDVLITNVERITPGKFYNNAIFFQKNKVPVVKLMMADGVTYDNGSFKYHKKVRPVIVKEVVKEKVIASTPSVVAEQAIINTTEALDEIIFDNGKTLLVKILSITNGKVHYKRSDILSGPVYIISLTIPGTLKAAKVIPNNGHKTIDFRN